MKLYEQVTISIASKDRHDEIESTLQHLYDFGLCDYPLIIFDDGSSPKLSPKGLDCFSRAKLLRSEAPLGQAIARNKIVQLAETPYVLQLDDDSYPVRGSLEQAIRQLEESYDCFALALALEEPGRGRGFYSSSCDAGLLQVQSFVGCSVLIHKERFLEIGGYADWIGRTVEEEELCLRALSLGYQVKFSQAVCIRHEVTDTGRDTSGILGRSVRNWTAAHIRHAPFSSMLWRLLRMGIFAGLMVFKGRRLSVLKAYCSALFSRHNWCSRAPVPSRSYHQFFKLKHALALFS